MQRALAASMEKHPDEVASEEKNAVAADMEKETCSTKKPVYLPLPEEPKGDRNILCRVGFRLPDGRRVQRNFLRTDPIQVRFAVYIFSHSRFSPLVWFAPVLALFADFPCFVAVVVVLQLPARRG